jgi:WD40 repeat protein
MVVSALLEQLIPSERGLARDEYVARATAAIKDDDDGIWRYQIMSSGDDSPPRNPSDKKCSASLADPPTTTATPATRKRRKRCKASKCLASLASDFDVVTDWAFYFHCRSANREYRAKYLEDPDADGPPYLIPQALMYTILVVCVLGTALWLTLATDGRIAAPLLRTLGYDKISMGYLLFFSVIIEDIPQVVLTFLVEDYFEEEGTFNNYALVNVVASLYDTLIKLAEAFDERTDVVETGMYCKESLWAHRDKITCVVPIPILDDDRDDDDDVHPRTSLGSSPALNAIAAVAKMSPPGVSRMHLEKPSLISRRKTLLEEAREIISDTKLPRLRFLSASEDKTVRLWDTNAYRIGHIRKNCVTAFRGHSASVTCLAIVELSKEKRRLLSSSNGGNDEFRDKNHPDVGREYEGTIFLTGSSDGSAKLWNSRTVCCLRTYVTFIPKDSTDLIMITSIAHLNTASASLTSTSTSLATAELFVCGYKNGKMRMLNMIDGLCLAIFDQHVDKVHSICALKTSDGFASAGQDGTIKIWKTLISKQKIDVDYSSTSFEEEMPSLSISSSSLDEGIGLNAPSLIQKSDRTVVGHVGAVLTVASISPQVILTGGADRTARLWNLEMEVCLRVFVGHVDSVTTVAVVDNVTFLTGSCDKTIKVWDGLSASCIRTYTGHTAPVTSVTTALPGTFISASEDLTIKLWVFTAVSPPANIDGGGTLNDLLGIDETVICMTCGKKGDTNDDYNQIMTV